MCHPFVKTHPVTFKHFHWKTGCLQNIILSVEIEQCMVACRGQKFAEVKEGGDKTLTFCFFDGLPALAYFAL